MRVFLLIADHLKAAAESVMAHDHASSMVVLGISESLRKAVDVLSQPGSDAGV